MSQLDKIIARNVGELQAYEIVKFKSILTLFLN